MFLDDFYILPSERGYGLGHSVMDALIGWTVFVLWAVVLPAFAVLLLADEIGRRWQRWQTTRGRSPRGFEVVPLRKP